MKKVIRVKNRMTLLLVSAILILCIAFMITACGTGPTTKAVNTDTSNTALDFSDCPIADACIVTFTTADFDSNKFQGKPLTFEAWVKPISTAAGTILQRMSVARGAALKIATTSTASRVTPTFSIRRPYGPSGSTSTVTYTVTSLTNIVVNAWTHIAGILTNDNHSAVHAACNVGADARTDPWHIDIYVSGTYSDCLRTYGGSDTTAAEDAYAHEPAAHTSAPGTFSGIIDEARVWNVERTISTCMSKELTVAGGACDVGSNDLITYLRFNTGSGHFVYDASGQLGAGAKEYAIGGNLYSDWSTGWSTDTPF